MFVKNARSILPGITLLTLCLFSQPGLTHHSAAMFDVEKTIAIEGTVSRVEWTNPHIWIHIDAVDENGQAVTWEIEHVSPVILKRQGWTRATLEEGESVSITFFPAKSGDTVGGFVRAVTADGTRLGTEGNEPHPELIEVDDD